MVIDIKMCRFDNVPWGFRLVGGSDFEFPLTVVKVSEGSIAEEAGLRIGDVIVRVNDTATSPLSHEEANQIIRHCGNVFYLGVYREEDETTQECKQFPVSGLEIRRTPDSVLEVESSCKSPFSTTCSEERDYIPDLPDRPCSVLSENAERKFVEEEIAAVLSGESEVLKEHNIMGILPKPGVCMSSDVLRTLNAEATKTKAEQDKENRKWTTFLQKPNRPIPKSKQQFEAERHAANAYKVQIVKSIRKSPAPEIVPAPIAQPTMLTTEIIATVEPETIDMENKSKDSATKEEIRQNEAPTPTDSEVPSLEDLPDEKLQSVMTTEILSTDADAGAAAGAGADNDVNDEVELNSASSIKSLEENQLIEESKSKLNDLTTENDEVKISRIQDIKPSLPIKTEEELALERQLADVQRQLVALSSLPSTIQSTLDAVTKQLAELLPAFKLQQIQTEPNTQQLKQIGESNDEVATVNDQEPQTEETKELNEEVIEPSILSLEDQKENNEIQNDIDKNSEVNSVDIYDEEVESLSASLKEECRPFKSAAPKTEEQHLKKEKKYEVIDELEEHLERKRNPKRSKRAFGPLTPSSERPLVLPGGRRWYRPKDAYNDEFIAEILSSQAELITGTTLGPSFESSHLGYDSRVNFMKYQKPERKIDLNRSEVYKVIHHLDRQPVRGIEVRPPMVAAEADIRRAMQS